MSRRIAAGLAALLVLVSLAACSAPHVPDNHVGEIPSLFPRPEDE